MIDFLKLHHDYAWLNHPVVSDVLVQSGETPDCVTNVVYPISTAEYVGSLMFPLGRMPFMKVRLMGKNGIPPYTDAGYGRTLLRKLEAFLKKGAPS
jgi:hypothetical protein